MSSTLGTKNARVLWAIGFLRAHCVRIVAQRAKEDMSEHTYRRTM